MSDGQWLLITFSALYLLECLRLIPVRDFVGTGHGRSWRLLSPNRNLSGRGLGLVLLPVLPPFGPHLHLSTWIFVPHEDHLEIRDGGASGICVAWNHVAVSVSDSLLEIEGTTTVRLYSSAEATVWRDRLIEWKESSPAKRLDLFLRDARCNLDTNEAENVVASLDRRIRVLNRLSFLAFLICLGLIAPLYRWLGDGTSLWAAVAVLFVIQFIQAALFLHTGKAGAQGPSVPWRRCKAVAIALLPHMCIRAADHLCHVVPVAHHPLSLRHLLSDSDWRRLACKTWREARYRPGWPDSDNLPVDALALKRFFLQQGIDISVLEELPEKQPTSAACCPRCHAQFERADLTCSDCAGVELREWGNVHTR